MKRMFLLMLTVGVLTAAGTAKAAVYYVDTTGIESDNLIATVAQAKANPGVDTVYVAIGLYKMNTELIVEDVIIGGCTFDGSGGITRQYPGAVGNDRNKMTILDGNSFVLTLPSQKHRVATINSGGIIDGCLIRNGHARGTTNNPNDVSGFGGGVLINTGGKLHNSIVRGNVAMNLQYSKTNPSYGGGVYVNGGDVANCIIAFNLDDMGLGIGGSSGTILNNTIARNANAPRYVLVTGNRNDTPYQHFVGLLGSGVTGPHIRLDDFYMASTETTQGQYSCFLAAMDITLHNAVKDLADWQGMLNANTPMYGYSNIAIHKYLGMTAAEQATPPEYLFTTQVGGGYHLGVNGILADSRVFYPHKVVTGFYGAGTRGRVDYPADPLVRENFPMGNVNWYGSVAFCVWLGGMLPTEAQWEYAARKTLNGFVTSNSVYAGGIASADEAGWYSSTGHEVGLLLPTEIGLYDLNGNVLEWCADWYVSYPTGESIISTGTAATGRYTVTDGAGQTGSSSGNPIYNPIYNVVGGSGSLTRVGRGGSRYQPVVTFGLGWRSRSDGYSGSAYLYPSDAYGYWGFRSVGCVGL